MGKGETTWKAGICCCCKKPTSSFDSLSTQKYFVSRDKLTKN